MHVAFFEGVYRLNEEAQFRGLKTIEEKVDDFLDCNPNIEIKLIKQSSASSGEAERFSNVTTVSIWYEEEAI